MYQIKGQSFEDRLLLLRKQSLKKFKKICPSHPETTRTRKGMEKEFKSIKMNKKYYSFSFV